MMSNSITPYQAQYKQREDVTTMMNIVFLTFFFAYMGYKILMDYTKTQDRWENRFQILEDHMGTIEENATFINNELVNSSEQMKEVQKEVSRLVKKISVLYKYAHDFDNDWHSGKWQVSFENEMNEAEELTVES